MTVKTEDVLEMIEIARETGKLKKGVNEATKAVERNVAKAVIIADDVDPPEIVMHLNPLCDEKKIAIFSVPSKVELGRAAGLDVQTAAIAITDLGDAKKKLDQIS
jgi:large subunit ribosomal protein L7Ae